MDDGFADFGLPFEVYAYGGFWTHSVVLWGGLIADVLVALCVSWLSGGCLKRCLRIRVERLVRRQERIALIVSAAERRLQLTRDK
jgi:hypothetical protein